MCKGKLRIRIETGDIWIDRQKCRVWYVNGYVRVTSKDAPATVCYGTWCSCFKSGALLFATYSDGFIGIDVEEGPVTLSPPLVFPGHKPLKRLKAKDFFELHGRKPPKVDYYESETGEVKYATTPAPKPRPPPEDDKQIKQQPLKSLPPRREQGCQCTSTLQPGQKPELPTYLVVLLLLGLRLYRRRRLPRKDSS